MPESCRDRHSRWQVAAVLAKYSGLRLAPSGNDIVLEGTLGFRVIGPDRQPLDDEYEVVLRLPDSAPNGLPTVRETGGRIPPSYHKLQGDFLCLGAATAIRLTLLQSPSLLTFVERYVIPYLYGYSYFSQRGHMPFGELAHGDDGIREYLAGLFGSHEPHRAEEFLLLAGMKKRLANKHPCPCLSGRRLGRCHHRQVNAVRDLAGRLWCRDEYERVVRTLGVPVSSRSPDALSNHRVPGRRCGIEPRRGPHRMTRNDDQITLRRTE
jgi:hypothetical protein